MNRFIRFAKLERIIKEAVKKSDDLSALRSIFMNKYPGNRAAAGLAQQYYDRFIGRSEFSAPVLTEGTLPQPLPDDITDLISLLRGSENAETINKLKSAYPDIDFDQFSSEYLKWLHSRYISREKEETHPIEDSIPTLLKFREFQDRYKNDASFREEVAQARLGDISSIEGLTIDHMEKVISLRSDLTVRVHGVDIKEKEFLGKFGDWNLWLPHTKETSAKIAGYDEDTYEPVTDWCTARTKGSNLFYNYIGRNDAPSFLFYIIKDNPEYDEDWLSLGYVSRGTKLAPDFSGKDGGLSVNRANEGLREEDYEGILGDQWANIRSRIEVEIEDFKKEDGTYESPARSIVLDLAGNLSKFKKEWYPKSMEEKKDFAEVILDSEPSKEVREEIYKFFAEKDPRYFLDSYVEESKSEFSHIIKIALKNFADKYPATFLEKNPHYGIKGGYRILAQQMGLDDLIKSSLERLSKEYPNLFISKHIKDANDYGLDELLKKSLEELVEKAPERFILYYIDIAKNKGLNYLIEPALKRIAEKDDKDFFVNFREITKAEGFGYLIESTLKRFVSENPVYFLNNYTKIALEEGLGDLRKTALENLASENPRYFISQYIVAARDLGLGHLTESILKRFAEEDPKYFLNYYRGTAKQEGLLDLIRSALERVALEDPKDFINYHKRSAKEFGVGHLIKSALEKIELEDPKSFLDIYKRTATEEGMGHLISSALQRVQGGSPVAEPPEGEVSTASIENKLLKLSRALKSLGLMAQSSRIRRLTL